MARPAITSGEYDRSGDPPDWRRPPVGASSIHSGVRPAICVRRAPTRRRGEGKLGPGRLEDSADDRHATGGGIEDRGMTRPGSRRSAGRRQLDPLRLSTQAVGVGQDPDVVVGGRRVAPCDTAPEDDHPVARLIVDGGVAIAGRREWARREQLVPGAGAHVENPHVVPHAAEPRRVAAEHDQAAAARIVHGRVAGPADGRIGQGGATGVPPAVRVVENQVSARAGEQFHQQPPCR
jgi:hypothetical protein